MKIGRLLRGLIACLVVGAFSFPAQAAVPTFVGYGSVGYASSGNCTAGLPSGTTTNDILLVFSLSNDLVGHTAPTGYTNKSSYSGTTNSVNRTVEIHWKRHDGSEGSATVGHSGGSWNVCVMAAFRGAITSGDPFDTVGTVTTNSYGNPTAPSITTTVNDDLVLFFVTDDSGTHFSGWTGPATTERFDVWNSVSSITSMALATGPKATAGATGQADVNRDGPYVDIVTGQLLSLKAQTVAAPGAPGNATYTNVEQTTLTVNWTAASGSPDSYKVERAPYSGSCGTYAQIASGVTTLYRNDTGRTAGVTYCYRMRATNAGGDGPYSTGTTVTMDSAAVPGAPTVPTYSNIGTTTVTVNWTQGSPISDTFKLERAPDVSGSAGTYSQIAGGISGTSYNDSGLSPSTPYWYRVSGTNVNGDSSYSTASFTTTSSVTETPTPGYVRWTCSAPDFNCFAVKTNGARVDFGAGALDYAYSDGSKVIFPGAVSVTGNLNVSGTCTGCGSGTVTHKSSDQTIATTSQTAVSDMSFTVAANTSYRFEVFGYLDHTAGAANVAAGFTGPASPTFIAYDMHGVTQTNGQVDRLATAFATNLNIGTPTEMYGFHASGILRNGANAGTVQLTMAADSGGSISVKQGMTLVVETF